MSHVTIVTGCAGVGKTAKLLKTYCTALERGRSENRPGTSLWLTPTHRIQKCLTQQVAGQIGTVCFAPNILTFDRFAARILEAAGHPASPISPVMKRLLIRRIAASLQEQGELRYFQPIVGTTGFFDVISSFISELKREEIWPETFVEACQQRTSNFARRDLEVGLIYSRYQQQLLEQNWYDNEGRFWLARTALSDGVRGPFADLRTLIVDGFADFTQTQYEILGYLASWIDEIFISLPAEQPLSRNDLFAKPQAAIARIEEQLPENATYRLERLPSGMSNVTDDSLPQIPSSSLKSVRIIADRLFANPRFVKPSSETDGLEIIEAIGPFAEWEAVARRIKALLNRGQHQRSQRSHSATTVAVPRPQDIVIGLRSISDDGPRLYQYLASAGLPVWCEAESPFTSSSVVRAIFSLLQLELEDWPFERLHSFLDSHLFHPGWPELESGRAIRAVAASLRYLRIDSGRDVMLRALRGHPTDSLNSSSTRGDSFHEIASLAAPLLTRLSKTLERLRRPHTLNDWADVLAALGDELGWKRRIDTANDELAIDESRDLDLLQRILRTAAEADQKLVATGRARSLSLADFVSEFRDLLSHETVNSETETGGCIRILGVEQIRNLDIPHLFLIGLTENSFPTTRTDDCLFSESERRDFISHGVALRHRSGHHADEMFLFYSVVTRARQSLTLSYPAVNSKGQPVFPSPYVTALKSLFSSDSLKETREGQLNPVPSVDRSITPTDLRLSAMVLAREGHPKLFRAVLDLDSLRKRAFNTLAACEVASDRFHERGFTKYEGRLELPQNLLGLRQRFGNHHQFSATEFESYARCPFQFWLSTVLKVGAVEAPEEGTDYAARGTLLHEVLAKLLIEGTFADPEALRNRFCELVDLQLDRHVPATELQRALIKIERTILKQWADAFVEQQGEYEQRVDEVIKETQSLAPEIPFGRLPEVSSATLEVHHAIGFGNGDNLVNLRGRIDRVDVGSYEGRPAYVVVDYKTGQRPSLKNDDLLSGRSIQLPLYLLAVKRLGLVTPDAVPYQMGFWALRDTGFKPGMGRSKFEPLDATVIQSLEILLDELLPRLAEGIRSGTFVVENNDPNCTGRCLYRTVCRVNQLRPLADSLGKRSPAPTDPTADEKTGQGSFSSRTNP
ncbi:MAG: PD-(D/E)XK nuclease family protein [Schlesneria sp.]